MESQCAASPETPADRAGQDGNGREGPGSGGRIPRFRGVLVKRRFRKRPTSFVTAVRLDLDTDGFIYRKWGGDQFCKPGDWLVDNDGDVYTVDASTFDRTYEMQSPGVYVKTTTVWAEVADSGGVVSTLEGTTEYEAGDYLVANEEDGSDAYAMSASKFEEMYQPLD